jgi:Capsule assembly protein Wzi
VKKKLLFIYIFCWGIYGFAQKSHHFGIETTGYVSTNNQLPFWLRVNQFGAVPQRSPALSSFLRAYSKSDSSKRFFDWNYGMEGFATLNARSRVHLIEGFVEAKVGSFVLSAGRKKEIVGLVDTLLSTGSVAWSGNALPVPRIQLATKGFVDVPFTKKMLAIQATYAHGWFGQQRIHPQYFLSPQNDYTPYWYNYFLNTYLHQKTLYGRFGKPTWKVNLYGGFNHQAFWGNEQQIWKQGFDLKPLEHYRRVVMGVNWWSSKIGNHFGTIDLGMTIKGKKWHTFLYRQSIYDTGSLLNALNLDALNGISLTRKMPSTQKINLTKILMEYLYTGDQRDPLLDPFAGVNNGRNSYFNHYIYLDGWRYSGLVLGTPFAVADTYLKENAVNEDFRSDYISNNRIHAVHLGLMGTYRSTYQFVFKTAISQNKGTYGAAFPAPRYQLSSFLSVSKHFSWLQGIDASCDLALDMGSLYPTNLGGRLSLKKSYSLSRR